MISPITSPDFRRYGLFDFRVSESVICEFRLEIIFLARKHEFVRTFRPPKIRRVHSAVAIKHFTEFRDDFITAFALRFKRDHACEIPPEIVTDRRFILVDHLRLERSYYPHRLARILGKRNGKIGFYGVFGSAERSATARVDGFSVEKVGKNNVRSEDFPALVRNDFFGFPACASYRKFGKKTLFVTENVYVVAVAELAGIPAVSDRDFDNVVLPDVIGYIVSANVDTLAVVRPPRHEAVGDFVTVDFYVENSRRGHSQLATGDFFRNRKTLTKYRQPLVFLLFFTLYPHTILYLAVTLFVLFLIIQHPSPRNKALFYCLVTFFAYRKAPLFVSLREKIVIFSALNKIIGRYKL